MTIGMEQGSRKITVVGNKAVLTNADGTGGTHSIGIEGGNVDAAINAFIGAYGKQIGTVQYGDGTTQVVNEFKANPKKEVDPSLLKETGKLYKINSGEYAGQYALKYSDGSYSYYGSGEEGKLEASRQYWREVRHNEALQDARTRDDFNTDDQYKSYLTYKNSLISRGMYDKVGNGDGTYSLRAPNGAIVATGNQEEIHKQYLSNYNKLNLAMRAAERVQSISSNEKRFIMEREGLDEQGFNDFIRARMQQRQDALNNIYAGWDKLAAEQGISTEGKNWYKPVLPDLTNFVVTVTESTMPYNQWYKENYLDKLTSPSTTLTGEEEGTDGGTGAGGGDDGDTGLVDTTITGDEGTTTTTDTDTTGGVYQPFVQTPTDTTTTVPSFQDEAGVYPTTGTSITGTVTTPVQTGGLSAVPEMTTTFPNYTGTTMSNLTSQSQQGFGGQVMYRNPQTGQMLYVTIDASGKPMTYVPPGFVPVSQAAGLSQSIAQPTLSTTQPAQATTNTTSSFDTAAAGNLAQTVLGMAEGGLVEAEKSMAAKFLGFKGGDLEKFLESNPAAAAKMGKYRKALRRNMAQGGMVPRATTIENQPHMLAYINPQEAQLLKQRGGTGQPGPGGIPAFANEEDDTTATLDTTAAGIGSALVGASGLQTSGTEGSDPYMEQLAAMQRSAVGQTMQPIQANVAQITPSAADFIGETAGQAVAQAPVTEAATVSGVTQVGMPTVAPTSVMDAATASEQVQATTEGLTAVPGTVSTQAQVDAAQQLTTSVSDVEAAQGTATILENPVERQIQDGELISGVANAETAAKFTEQVEAATATPTKKATVAGQLEGLMQQFEGGETPPWAAGSMRTAMQTLAARGLGASSLAGQAVIQAAMEAALPIAQMDAQVQAQFEAQNLSNRQQRAMLAAQQRASFLGQEFDQAFQARVQNSARIGDIANMNFTAEQQIALENSRAANTMDLSNLNNRQAKVMAEAAALSQLDTANLSNRQQAAVQNAQNFMQMDMANLSNEQQTALFKAQQNIQALFTDQAAENAAAQFNATSENQSNQFFANLSSQVGQFNAAQQNAMDQFNVNSVNAIREFNSELQQQRDLFNAQNGLVIAQSNAQWRQNIATINTAALNESNAEFARTMNGLTELNMAQIWQRERDIMSYVFQTMNNNADRATSIAIQNLQNEAAKTTAAGNKSAGFAKAAGTIIGAIITG